MAATGAVMACGDGPRCPTLTVENSDRAESGEYFSVSDRTVEHAPAKLVIDAEADTVQVRYLRDGKLVVETWRVTRREVR